jgi:hypothetical protein
VFLFKRVLRRLYERGGGVLEAKRREKKEKYVKVSEKTWRVMMHLKAEWGESSMDGVLRRLLSSCAKCVPEISKYLSEGEQP